jgi:hypothetical protein
VQGSPGPANGVVVIVGVGSNVQKPGLLATAHDNPVAHVLVSQHTCSLELHTKFAGHWLSPEHGSPGLGVGVSVGGDVGVGVTVGVAVRTAPQALTLLSQLPLTQSVSNAQGSPRFFCGAQVPSESEMLQNCGFPVDVGWHWLMPGGSVMQQTESTQEFETHCAGSEHGLPVGCGVGVDVGGGVGVDVAGTASQKPGFDGSAQVPPGHDACSQQTFSTQ